METAHYLEAFPHYLELLIGCRTIPIRKWCGWMRQLTAKCESITGRDNLKDGSNSVYVPRSN